MLTPLPVAADLSASKLQPLRLVAAAAGHVALALRGGRSLYTVDTSGGALVRAAGGALLSHHAQPVCALAFSERQGGLLLVALQEDAAVCVWSWSRSEGSRGAWQPLASLPPVASHRGVVRAACMCVSGSRTCLAWLLYRPERGVAELLLRPLHLPTQEGAGAEARVERLGRLSDASQLLCSPGCSELWVVSTTAAARWCLHSRVCTVRAPLLPDSVAALHVPSRELLVRSPAGEVVALGPPLRHNGSHPPRNGEPPLAPRRVGTLPLPAAALPGQMLADGRLLYWLHGNQLAAHHLASGRCLASVPCPSSADLHMIDGACGGAVLWHGSEAGVCLWRVAVPAAPAAALLLRRSRAAYGSALIMGECAAWGGCLAACENGAALYLARDVLSEPSAVSLAPLVALAAAQSRHGEWPDVANADALALLPALRSLVPLLSFLHQRAEQNLQSAEAWRQARASLEALHGAFPNLGEEGAASAFRCFTPLSAATSHAWGSMSTIAALPTLDVLPPLSASRLDWADGARALADTAQAEAAGGSAAAAALLLFSGLLASGEALCGNAWRGCLVCAAVQQQHSPQARAGAVSVLATSLARFADTASTTPSASPSPQAAPAFEAACLALFATVPAALPAFVRAAASNLDGRESLRSLSARALRHLPPALGRSVRGDCSGVVRAEVAAQAELLCLAGLQGAGMWLALQPPMPCEQPDWATAVRLLERECGTAGGCASSTASLAVVPLMFEILAARVCETLVPEADDDAAAEYAESEALAACVAHLFIAAKSVATLFGSARANAPVGRKVRLLWAPPHPSKPLTRLWHFQDPPVVLDALHGVLDAGALAIARGG